VLFRSEQFYRDEFPKYKAGFEDRNISIIRHDDVLEDHRAVKLVRGVPRVRARRITRRYVISVMLGLHKAGMQARAKRDERGGPGMISRMALLRATGACFLSRQPKADLPADLFWDLTGRYLRHIIWRKGLVLGRGLYRMGGLIREYAMVLVYYALIEFEARRRAEEMGAEAAILEAIRTVERDFVLHAGRDATGPREEERDAFELFLGLFDSLVNAKSFAPSMTFLSASLNLKKDPYLKGKKPPSFSLTEDT